MSPQLVVDLLRAETARLLVEEPDDREARGPAPIAGGAQLGERALRPGCGGRAHRADDNGDENRYRLPSDENRSRLAGGSRAPRGRLCRLRCRQGAALGRRRLLSARFRRGCGRGLEGARREPDAARGRAARRRAHATRSGPPPGRGRRPLPLPRLPAGGAGRGRGGERQARGRARRARPEARSRRRRREDRSTRLARPGPVLEDRPADRRRRSAGPPGPRRSPGACARSTASTAPASGAAPAATSSRATRPSATSPRATACARSRSRGSIPRPSRARDGSQQLIDLVRREHVTTVFFERLVSPRLAETVAREAGAKAEVLDPIEGLTPSEEQQGDDYFSLMRRNLTRSRLRSDAASARVRRTSSSATSRGSRCFAMSISRSRPASSSRSQARTAAGRRRCSGSRSVWSGRPAATCASSASRPTSSATARGSGTWPSARTSASTLPRPCARSSTPGAAPRKPFGRFARSDDDAIEEAIERVGLAELSEPAVDSPLRRSAAAGVHRQGARGRAAPARARRADHRCRRRVAGGARRAARRAFIASSGSRSSTSRTSSVRSSTWSSGSCSSASESSSTDRPSALPELWHDPSHAHA